MWRFAPGALPSPGCRRPRGFQFEADRVGCPVFGLANGTDEEVGEAGRNDPLDAGDVDLVGTRPPCRRHQGERESEERQKAKSLHDLRLLRPVTFCKASGGTRVAARPGMLESLKARTLPPRFPAYWLASGRLASQTARGPGAISARA